MKSQKIEAAVFDFGGVLADEGFKNGLYAIARANNKDPEGFEAQARELIYSSGYLTGKTDESTYWEALRRLTGISGNDSGFREAILQRFTLRQWMFDVVEKLRDAGIRLVILSDQTNWLDELEEKLHFSRFFEKVFNSYHTGKSKRDQSLFEDVLGYLCLKPSAVVFVDDSQGHIERARNVGLHTIWFQGRDEFIAQSRKLFPGLLPPG